MSDWIIDGEINLTRACEQADWHLASAIEALVASGLDRAEADDFARFAFADRAQIRGDRPEDCITEAQWERLSC